MFKFFLNITSSEKWFHFKIQFLFGHLFHFVFNIWAFISFRFQYLGIYFISFLVTAISKSFENSLANGENWDNLSSSILWFKNIDWISFSISRTRSEDVWRRWVRSTKEYTETEGTGGEGVRCKLGYSTPGSQVSGDLSLIISY